MNARLPNGRAQGASLSRHAALLLGLVLPALLLAHSLFHVHAFTVDDSFISYRYARNLARGIGLVYNPGERVEGYTNFLWTVLLAGGVRLGVDPELLSKLMGAASAFASLALSFAISGRLLPFNRLPCLATWLLASSIVFTGWSVFGLETGLFVCLVLAGTYLFLRESEPSAFPFSGLAFTLAGLTRPEAPMFLGLLMLLLGRRALTRQNLLRGALFVGPLLLHLLFRRLYYGAWLPNTFFAKTGDPAAQATRGAHYVLAYFAHAGPAAQLAWIGLGIGVASRRRDILALALLGLGVVGYVLVVGGDWMNFFRFMAPFEPFCFLLADLGTRSVAERQERAVHIALAGFALFVAGQRTVALREAQAAFAQEKQSWDAATRGMAEWLIGRGRPGGIALGDIGYIGWVTDYPVTDLLGLVDPVIARLPGGQFEKVGPGLFQRLSEQSPRYVLLITADLDCQRPSVPSSRAIFEDARFPLRYMLAGRIPVNGGGAYCAFEQRSEP